MMPACPIVPNQRQGDDGTVLGILAPEAALPRGSWKCPTGLNLRPVLEHSSKLMQRKLTISSHFAGRKFLF
jgi:hypothetical protein